MKKFWSDNSLSIVMLGLFAVFWAAMSVAGWHEYNSELQQMRLPELSYAGYLQSGAFWSATFENWESEFLQMSGYVLLTSFLVQLGSAESKDPHQKSEADQDSSEHKDDADAPGPVRAGGWKLKLYQNSLSLSLFLIFAGSFLGHARGGAIRYSIEQRAHGEREVSMWEYLGTSSFWFESFQNWQSEFLAVAAIVILSIRLRQKGSPESKPLHAPHSKTGAQ